MQRSGENPWAFFVVTVGGGGDGAATERRVQQLTRGNETISHVARTHLQKRALIPLPQSNSRKSTCGRLNKSNHRRRGLVFQPKPSLVDTGFLGDLQKDRRGVGLSCGHKKRGPPVVGGDGSISRGRMELPPAPPAMDEDSLFLKKLMDHTPGR